MVGARAKLGPAEWVALGLFFAGQITSGLAAYHNLDRRLAVLEERVEAVRVLLAQRASVKDPMPARELGAPEPGGPGLTPNAAALAASPED